MNPIGFDRDQCIQNLQSFCDEIREIVALIGEDGALTAAEQKTARQLLKNLKAALKTDYKRRTTREGKAQMTAIEARCYLPAVHEASVIIKIAVNSVPGKRWISDLDSARGLLAYYLSRLDQQ